MSFAIRFNSVTSFVEQVGRRLQWKYAELDNMVCIYNGPSYGAIQFKPPINAPHPQYPLMFVTDSSIDYKDAGIAEVRVTYAGIIQTNGTGSYVTPPVTSESPVQGSRDFVYYLMVQTFAAQYQKDALGNPITGYSLPALYNYGTQTVTVRYIGTQCSIRYQAYPRPTGLKYSSLGIGRVNWTILSQFRGPMQIAGSNVEQGVAQAAVNQMIISSGGTNHIPPLYAANLGVSREQRGLWYNCVEVYGPTF